MAQASSARSEGHGNVAARNAQDSSATRHDPDDGAYPSSESDAEMDDGAHSKESRPLFADDENAEQPQDEREATQPTTANGHAHSNSPQQGPRRRTPLKWTEYIWVTFTLLLIAILGYSSQLCIILPYYHKTPSFSPQTLAALLIPFNVGLLGIFYNYYLCVFTDPGSVPSGWQPDWSALDPVAPTLPAHTETDPSLELKETIYRPRYCKTCSSYKPPRSHHCKTCQRCVLRMDHHCPWLANCVGHYNYAHFIRFLFWVDVTCLYHIIMISCRVLDRFNSYTYWREPSVREVVWLVVNYALCIPVILLVGIFSGYHFYCTAINQTTIESWEKDRTATMIRRGRIRKIKYPYNLGFMRNVRSVMGDNVLTWCLPRAAGEQRGDGLKYPVAPGLDEGAQYRWPPKDPSKTTAHLPYSQGWRADGTEAPPLFALPGATSNQAFTYGSGFNPNLRPTNSASLRNRGAPRPNVVREEESEDGLSSISSGSDDEVEVNAEHARAGLFEPNEADLDGVNGYGDYEEYEEEDVFDEEDEEEEGEIGSRRVAIRRGSEGYEVRPRSAWVV